LATVLGRYDEAASYFDQAAEFNDRADARYFAAETNLWWGKMHIERNCSGDLEEAHALLNRAHIAASTYGYSSVKRRAAAALHGLG
jgi:tetratricopeptide (TPR) repeat protein